MRRFSTGDRYDPSICSNIMLMPSHDFAQPTPHTVADHRAAQVARRHKSRTKCRCIFHRKHTERQELAALDSAISLYPLKFRGAR